MNKQSALSLHPLGHSLAGRRAKASVPTHVTYTHNKKKVWKRLCPACFCFHSVFQTYIQDYL